MTEDKAGFVQELGELIANYAEDRTGVTAMEYLEDSDGFEAVTIYFVGGGEDTVNVTGNSCMGIMVDIAERLWLRKDSGERSERHDKSDTRKRSC